MFLLKPILAPMPPGGDGICRICKKPYAKTSRIQVVCPKPECRKQAQHKTYAKSAKKRMR